MMTTYLKIGRICSFKLLSVMQDNPVSCFTIASVVL